MALATNYTTVSAQLLDFSMTTRLERVTVGSWSNFYRTYQIDITQQLVGLAKVCLGTRLSDGVKVINGSNDIWADTLYSLTVNGTAGCIALIYQKQVTYDQSATEIKVGAYQSIRRISHIIQVPTIGWGASATTTKPSFDADSSYITSYPETVTVTRSGSTLPYLRWIHRDLFGPYAYSQGGDESYYASAASDDVTLTKPSILISWQQDSPLTNTSNVAVAVYTGAD